MYDLAAGACITADEALDIDGGAGHEAFERFLPADVADPMLDSKLFFCSALRDAARSFGNHLFIGGRKRPRFIGEAVDGRVVAISRYQRGEGLDKMPGGTVHTCLVAGVDVGMWTAAPSLTSRYELELDDALGAEIDADFAIEALGSEGHEDAITTFKRSQDFGSANNLGKVGRSDFLLTFGNKDQVHGQLAAGPADGMEGRDERSFRPFLIDGAAADHHFSKTGLVDNGGVPGRRRPLGWIYLLDVVHKVNADSARSSGVEDRKYSGLAIGGHFGDFAKSSVRQETHGQVAALGDPFIFGRDRRLVNPFLQAPDSLVMLAGNLLSDGFKIAGIEIA